MNVSITIDTKELERDLTAMQRRIIPRAGASAINKTLKHGRTLSVRSLAKATGLAQAKIRPYVDMDKAIPARLVGRLRASGKHIPLAEFPSSQTKKGVKAKAWGKWTKYPGTFFTRVGSGGHLGIFHRGGKSSKLLPRKRWRRTKTGRAKKGQAAMVRSRLPIEELWGPSVPKEFKKIIDKSLERTLKTKLKENYIHELNVRTKGIVK
jgi:hypothetical protein